ncbi:hypothetical protein CCR75_009376 [Bremia lactucae]|uniref:Purple acid phosphatase N-terminal domain-containing protein n=1 Tax=Bremia lactucae TaxID=4779 RepID=A0A976FLS0_BRELC|nr:hypothetical protein CCR75_009376 [Bremia lactucae]
MRNQAGRNKYELLAEDGETSTSSLPRRTYLFKRAAFLLIIALCGVAIVGVLLITFGRDVVPLSSRMKLFSMTADNESSKSKNQVGFRLKSDPVLLEDGSDLFVSWEGEAAVALTDRDFLTLSCGPTNNYQDFIAMKNATDSDNHSIRFYNLYMLRCNYTVIYFNYDKQTNMASPIAKLEVGMKEPFETPKHGHLSLTDDDNAMAIMFNSGSKKTPMVKYGENPKDLKFHATGTTTTYRADDLCQAPANVTGQQSYRDPGYMHTVIMTDLKPETLYYYQYGLEDVNAMSQVRSFKSKAHTNSRHAKFIAYADMGSWGATTAGRVYKDVTERGYDTFLLHFGDISYARGDGRVWDHFFHMIEPYATRPLFVDEYDYDEGGIHDLSGGMLPYGGGFNPSWGNFEHDSGGECGVPMHHRWHAPGTGNGIYWYSFDYSGIHVIQMSTEHNWTRGSEQYEWLRHDLEQVNRSVTPWVVLTAHRMMYTTQMYIDGDMNVSYKFQEEVEDLIYKHRVNLMMVLYNDVTLG